MLRNGYYQGHPIHPRSYGQLIGDLATYRHPEMSNGLSVVRQLE